MQRCSGLLLFVVVVVCEAADGLVCVCQYSFPLPKSPSVEANARRLRAWLDGRWVRRYRPFVQLQRRQAKLNTEPQNS